MTSWFQFGYRYHLLTEDVPNEGWPSKGSSNSHQALGRWIGVVTLVCESSTPGTHDWWDNNVNAFPIDVTKLGRCH